MYESPINLIVTDIYNQMQKQQEEEVYKAVLHYVPDVDKAELIRALQYDREQYSKGYADGKRDAMAELVRCKDCIHITPVEGGLPLCTSHNIARAYNDFCSDGARVVRDDAR
jgi:hypothetical protein